jgi:Glutathione peroxidase
MIHRRTVLSAGLAAITGPVPTRAALAQADMSRITAYAFSFPALEGGNIRLAEYTGRPLMVVNTASLCGYTPQYAGLQALWTEFHDRGLMLIGVPSNDFWRTGTRRRDRNRGDRAASIRRYLSDHRQSRGKGPKCPPILQMGG